MKTIIGLAVATFAFAQQGVAPCPGEGPRYGDYKCNHDGTHRVCAKLVDESTSQPLQWGAKDFWAITG